MIVDDEPFIRKFVRDVLEREGYAVIDADCGGQALALYASFRDDIDVCLTDVRMPEMDGLELCRRLRQLGANFPVVFMTGYTDETLPENSALLTKPFRIEQLINLVAKTVES